MQAPKGLEGVVVAQTHISDVQPGGQLSYRGQAIDQVVKGDFLDVASLVVTGTRQPDWRENFELRKHLHPAQAEFVLRLPRSLSPMAVLQTMVPLLAASGGLEHPLERGFDIAAKLPEVLLTHLAGEPVRLPDANGDKACYALQIVSILPGMGKLDRSRLELLVKALNVTQMLQIEHSMNAGTFAARVVASTKAQVEGAIVAGFAALSGELHGGADQDAIKMADRLNEPKHAAAFVRDMLQRGEKIPGMGHREYRVRDPRAVCLDEWAMQLADTGALQHTYLKLQAIEQAMVAEMSQRGKDVYTNVDFYKGIIYRALGLPDQAFTAMFALARVYGYLAHYLENALDNRIYRPQAQYVGEENR